MPERRTNCSLRRRFIRNCATASSRLPDRDTTRGSRGPIIWPSRTNSRHLWKAKPSSRCAWVGRDPAKPTLRPTRPRRWSSKTLRNARTFPSGSSASPMHWLVACVGQRSFRISFRRIASKVSIGFDRNEIGPMPSSFTIYTTPVRIGFSNSNRSSKVARSFKRLRSAAIGSTKRRHCPSWRKSRAVVEIMTPQAGRTSRRCRHVATSGLNGTTSHRTVGNSIT